MLKEATLRKWHRLFGMALGLLIFLQVLTGVILSVENLMGEYWSGILHDIHEGYGKTGNTVRLFLGLGLLWMTCSGGLISLAIFRRKKQQAQRRKADNA